MQPEQEMSQRWERVKARLTQAAGRCGRTDASVRLVAVSKTQGPERVRQLFACGQTVFGENYAQELLSKAQALADLPIDWVFIGQLQSNKIKRIVEVAGEIQAVASFKHAAMIAEHAHISGKTPYPIFLALNAGQEASKGGLAWEACLGLAERIASELGDSLSLQGIMCIPPRLADPGQRTELYARIKAVSRSIGRGLLSLGMSEDLEAAVEAGSDCVRIGTDLFGPRQSTRSGA